MIKTKSSNSIKTLQKEVDKHKNMLIIGAGDTTYAMNKIMYYDSPEIVEKLYGVSELSIAFKRAKQIGAPHVFLINAKRKTDYIEIVNTIKYYDFTYIVPLGVSFSETFYNSIASRQMTFSEFYLESIGDYNKSLLLMTDSHASLYEDIDHFLNDMFSKIKQFKGNAFKSLRNGRNICLVANNLIDDKFSNLVLASVLCSSNLASYPEYSFGEAIFDIDDFDVYNNELIYFKNNHLKNTTVENLKNFRIEKDAAKIITIDKVIKYIERELDFSEYKGKQFSEYIRMQFYKQLSKFLRNITGIAIRGYSVNSVSFTKTSPGVGMVVNDFTIIPINSTEDFNIIIEV